LREISDIEIIALADDLTRSRFLRYVQEASRNHLAPKPLLGTFIAQITSPPMQNVFPEPSSSSAILLLVELPSSSGCLS